MKHIFNIARSIYPGILDFIGSPTSSKLGRRGRSRKLPDLRVHHLRKRHKMKTPTVSSSLSLLSLPHLTANFLPKSKSEIGTCGTRRGGASSRRSVRRLLHAIINVAKQVRGSGCWWESEFPGRRGGGGRRGQAESSVLLTGVLLNNLRLISTYSGFTHRCSSS